MNFLILIASILVLNINFSQQQQSCSYVSNFDSTGTALRSANTVYSLNECCLSCQIDAACVSWTYACAPNSNVGYCFLKSSIGQLYPCSGRFTGVKNSSSIATTTPVQTVTLTTAASTTTGSVSTVTTTTARAAICLPTLDVNYPGNDIPNQGFGNIANFQDCCNLCGANPSCTAFAYSTVDRYCWLKNPTLDGEGNYNGQIDPYDGYISGSLVARRKL